MLEVTRRGAIPRYLLHESESTLQCYAPDVREQGSRRSRTAATVTAKRAIRNEWGKRIMTPFVEGKLGGQTEKGVNALTPGPCNAPAFDPT